MDLERSHDPSETEFVSVPLDEQLDADPIGPSDANALEDGDDLGMIQAAWDGLDSEGNPRE